MKHRRLAAAVAVLALALGSTAPAIADTAPAPAPAPAPTLLSTLLASLVSAGAIDQSSITVTVTRAGGGRNDPDETDTHPQTYTSLAAANVRPGDYVQISLTATPAAIAKHRYIPVFLADYWQPAPPLPSFPPGPIRPAHLSGALLSNANPTATLSLTAFPPGPVLPFFPPQPIIGGQLVLGVGLPLPLLTNTINYNTLPIKRAVQQAPIAIAPAP